MTPEEEALVRQIENTVRDSKIVPSGVNVSGGFPDLPDATTSIERLQNILKAHEDFKIVGGDNVTVSGSLKKGYAICSTCPETSPVGFPSPVPPPPFTSPTGACCADDGTCTITTEAECTGTFQGIGSVCTLVTLAADFGFTFDTGCTISGSDSTTGYPGSCGNRLSISTCQVCSGDVPAPYIGMSASLAVNISGHWILTLGLDFYNTAGCGASIASCGPLDFDLGTSFPAGLHSYSLDLCGDGHGMETFDVTIS